MSCLRASTFLRSVVLPVALVFWLSGCHKWVDLQPPYGPAIEVFGAEELRLTANGERSVTRWATVRGDTVLAGSLRIPLENLDAVEVRKNDTLAVIAAVVLSYAALAAIYASSALE